jgi:hypothetical protein
MEKPHPFDEFRLARKLDATGRFVHSVLLIALIVGVNLFGIRFVVRWDITPNRTNSLSAETLAHLKRLDQVVDIYVLAGEVSELPRGSNVAEELDPLLEAYRLGSNRGGKEWIRLHVVDVYRDREQVLALKQRFDLDRDNLILLESGNNRRVVQVETLWERRVDQDQWVFNGEAMLTAALLGVSDTESKRIFFTVGHGEMLPDDIDPQRGLSELSRYCRERRIEVGTIDLSRHDFVPDWVDLLVIASPQAGMAGHDVEKVRRYVEYANGSVLVLLEPFRQHHLEELFLDWGVLADDAVIIDPGPDFQSTRGNLILRRFAEHPVTQPMIDQRLFVFSNRPRPVRLDPAGPRIAGVQRTALVGTSETSWMEASFRTEAIPVFTEGRDLMGPIPVVVLAERRGGESLGLRLRGGKLVVMGDAMIATNELFRLYGNRVLLTNTINWCLQRNHLLTIPPQRISSYRLSLSEADLRKLLLVLLVMPAGFAVLGIFIRILRR